MPWVPQYGAQRQGINPIIIKPYNDNRIYINNRFYKTIHIRIIYNNIQYYCYSTTIIIEPPSRFPSPLHLPERKAKA